MKNMMTNLKLKSFAVLILSLLFSHVLLADIGSSDELSSDKSGIQKSFIAKNRVTSVVTLKGRVDISSQVLLSLEAKFVETLNLMILYSNTPKKNVALRANLLDLMQEKYMQISKAIFNSDIFNWDSTNTKSLQMIRNYADTLTMTSQQDLSRDAELGEHVGRNLERILQVLDKKFFHIRWQPRESVAIVKTSIENMKKSLRPLTLFERLSNNLFPPKPSRYENPVFCQNLFY